MNTIQPQRILYRWNQFLILTKNFILYIGIQLVPSLKWKIQEDITMNRANEQSNLLIASSTNIWQKIIVLNTVFKPRISYLSYAIPFSRLNMCKINKILIKLTKTICTIPNNTTKILVDLNDDDYAINTTSILLDYITYVSKQLIQSP